MLNGVLGEIRVFPPRRDFDDDPKWAYIVEITVGHEPGRPIQNLLPDVAQIVRSTEDWILERVPSEEAWYIRGHIIW
jgi:hypothetical protein